MSTSSSQNGNISPFEESRLDILATLRNLEIAVGQEILAQGNKANHKRFLRSLSWLSDIITSNSKADQNVTCPYIKHDCFYYEYLKMASDFNYRSSISISNGLHDSPSFDLCFPHPSSLIFWVLSSWEKEMNMPLKWERACILKLSLPGFRSWFKHLWAVWPCIIHSNSLCLCSLSITIGVVRMKWIGMCDVDSRVSGI